MIRSAHGEKGFVETLIDRLSNGPVRLIVGTRRCHDRRLLAARLGSGAVASSCVPRCVQPDSARVLGFAESRGAHRRVRHCCINGSRCRDRSTDLVTARSGAPSPAIFDRSHAGAFTPSDVQGQPGALNATVPQGLRHRVLCHRDPDRCGREVHRGEVGQRSLGKPTSS